MPLESAWDLCYIFQGAGRDFSRSNRSQIPSLRGFPPNLDA